MVQASRHPDFEIPSLRMESFGHESVTHAFYGRAGGLSQGVYKSLNCGPGSGDDIQNIQANRKLVADEIGVKPKHLLSLHQAHGNLCIFAEDVWSIDRRPQGDAMITHRPGFALGILTADCAPVLFHAHGKAGLVIAAAHAGWKGALGGVLEAVVNAYKAYEIAPDAIKAAIGPAIGKRSYEVGAEFMESFTSVNAAWERFFMESPKAGHWFFDLPGFCAARLYNAGVQDVSMAGLDTYKLETDYFSYRRSTHRAESDYGRQISVIAIPE